MEDVLEVYQRPYDPKKPQVCLDETSKQLLEHVRTPIAPAPGQPARVDDEYRRCGTANIFLAVEPLTGHVVLEATERRTSVDFAKYLRRLSDEHYPEAERIVLVLDNLSTHSLASLYEAFDPAEARRLVERFELHFTPMSVRTRSEGECIEIFAGRAASQKYRDAGAGGSEGAGVVALRYEAVGDSASVAGDDGA
jgi:hypothetical protein